MMLQIILLGLGLPTTAAIPSSAAAGGVKTDSATEAPHLSPMEISIWNDPAFKQRFAESYLAETEIEPTLTLVEREEMQEFLEYMSEDKLDKAIAQLEKNRGEGASAVFDFALANIHFQAEELEQAAVHYRTAVRKHPKFRRAWGNLGMVLMRLEDYRGAADALTKVLALGGGDALNYGLIGHAYSNLDKSLAAESAYRMAVLLDPETVDWKRGLVRSFFKQGRYADAIALCDSLIADHPDEPALWLMQANAYIGLGKPLKAAENYELIDRLGGSTAGSLTNLGDIYVNEGLFDLATGSYAKALETEEDSSPERAIRAARVMASRGELAQTSILVDRIEELRGEQLSNENKKTLLKLRSRIAVAAGANDEEARVLEQIVELDPLDGEALILLGKHARRTGDPEKSAFYYERAANLEGFEADAKLAHAQLLVGQGQYDQAISMLKRAQLLKPRDNVQQYLEQVERVAQKR